MSSSLNMKLRIGWRGRDAASLAPLLAVDGDEPLHPPGEEREEREEREVSFFRDTCTLVTPDAPCGEAAGDVSAAMSAGLSAA
jgi:hypothetical protein